MKNLQFLGLVIASVVALAPTAGYGDSRLGQKVDDFQLQSHLGRAWSLSDFDDKKIVVLAFRPLHDAAQGEAPVCRRAFHVMVARCKIIFRQDGQQSPPLR